MYTKRCNNTLGRGQNDIRVIPFKDDSAVRMIMKISKGDKTVGTIFKSKDL